MATRQPLASQAQSGLDPAFIGGLQGIEPLTHRSGAPANPSNNLPCQAQIPQHPTTTSQSQMAIEQAPMHQR